MPTTLNREQILERVCQLAAEQAGMSAAEVSLDSHLVHDLNFDSLDKVEFTMTVEDEFDVSISDDRADRVNTVRDAAELLLSALTDPRE